MLRRLFRISSFAAMLVLAACVTAAPKTGDLDKSVAVATLAATQSDAERLRMDIAWLADDAREGRETGTAGYLAAAEYVAARLDSMGVMPGVDGGWFQNVPFRSATPVLEAARLSISGPNGEVHELTHLDDFRVFPSMNAQTFSIENAEAVFIGFGIHAPEFGHDDYAGVDLEGKVAVYFSGSPDTFDNESRAHFNNSGLRMQEVSSRGAIGMISLFTADGEQNTPWARYTANPSSTTMTWVWPDGRADTSGPNLKGTGALNPKVASLLFEGAERSYKAVRKDADAGGAAPGSFDLKVRVSMTGAVALEETTSPNVVGLIRGVDPDLRDEYVVLSGHLDHLGIDERRMIEGKDGIKNGAMDNAAGIATMLEVARRLSSEKPPARSVLIVAVTAEEKGLLGADYFAHFPTVGEGDMVANVNLDMPVMLHEFTNVIAFGAERSSLATILESALDQTGVGLQSDPIPQLGIFTRSDHYRFVEQGVPSIYLWTGFSNGGEEKFWDFYKNHYHSPSDDISQSIRYHDLARFANINYIIARAIADAPERPRWNEGDFFGDLFSGK